MLLDDDTTAVPWSNIHHFNLSEQATFTAQVEVEYSSTITPVEMYIIEQGLLSRVDLEKVHSINSGSLSVHKSTAPTLSISIIKYYNFLEDVGSTLYKVYTYVSCLLGICRVNTNSYIQQTQDVKIMLVYCWASVVNNEQTNKLTSDTFLLFASNSPVLSKPQCRILQGLT